MIWLILAALAVGLLLILSGRGARRSHGIGDGRTLALDNRTLYSSRYRLSGRPDRIIEDAIAEEWKSGSRVYDSHRAQLGCYFVLIEEATGVRPTHGFISLASGQRVRVENTEQLRAWVLDVADQIRMARRNLSREIPVRQPPTKCRGCGQRPNCGQAGG